MDAGMYHQWLTFEHGYKTIAALHLHVRDGPSLEVALDGIAPQENDYRNGYPQTHEGSFQIDAP